MNYTVRTERTERIILNETNTVASILQNVAIILATHQGSCPLYRNFGISGQFLDKPMPAAKVLTAAEIKEAVEQFEPRATVVGVVFEEEPAAPGRLAPVVEVRINDE